LSIGYPAGQLTEINWLIEEGKLKIHIETVLPLTEVKKADQLSQSGRTRGKIVLQVETPCGGDSPRKRRERTVMVSKNLTIFPTLFRAKATYLLTFT
jgi:Zinc-binding dehydrogenase